MWSPIRIIRRRIAFKLTLTLVRFVALSSLVAGLYLDRALARFPEAPSESRLVSIAGVLDDGARAALASGGAGGQVFAMRSAAAAGARVTLIALDGRVVGESERSAEQLELLDNHRDRPEVKAALDGRRGRDLRTSATIDTPLLYVALPVQQAVGIVGVLRLALPLAAVTSSYETLHRVMLAGGVVALAVAFGIGVFVAGRVTRPVVEMQSIARQMSQGNFLVRAPTRSPDQIGTRGRP